jgi:integrase
MQDNNIKIINFPEYDDELCISYELYPVSLLGKRYDLGFDFINLTEGHKINFSLLNSKIVEHVKALISHVLCKNSETTAFNYFNLIKQYIEFDSDDELAIEQQIKESFKNIMNDKSISPEIKSYLRNAYRFFADEDMPYFSQDFVDFYLDEIQFGSGNKGLDVLVQMKNRGCLTLSETREFKESIGKVDYKELRIYLLQGFVALRIGQLTGARDVQVRRLKYSHFVKVNKDGKDIYYLKIPRAKQRGQSGLNQTVSRPITPQLAKQIEYLMELNGGLGDQFEDHYLLCPLASDNKSVENKILTSQLLRHRIFAMSSNMGVDFTLNLRRLRKTFCSSLIARGVSKNVVAFLMDHSDHQQLDVYYRQTYAVAKKLDQILRKEAGDLLDAFAGKIIKQGEESLNGQTIFAPIKDSKLIKIGSCGSGKLCVLNPPLSCYGCKSLEAFEDVDHSEVLDQMIVNAQETFGEEHSVELAQSKHYIAAGALIKIIEGGEYE